MYDKYIEKIDRLNEQGRRLARTNVGRFTVQQEKPQGLRKSATEVFARNG